MRPETTLESLAGLKPAFAGLGKAGFDAVALQRYHSLERIDHVHTAAASSGIVDGAALVVIGSENVGKVTGLQPRARVVATATSGADSTIMLTGPVPATRKLLTTAGLTADAVDLFEVNEAFASVPLHFGKALGVEQSRINVNGGAIAMGHPLGATGAMLVGTLVDELERRDLRRGVVTLCIGGGMGVATLIEPV
jgi:acetyl-CoA C-acetyltransferase